jgi:hypothetical protein
MVANILNKQSRADDKGRSSSFGIGRRVRTPERKKTLCYKMLHRDSDFDGFFGISGQLPMIFGTWIVTRRI